MSTNIDPSKRQGFPIGSGITFLRGLPNSLDVDVIDHLRQRGVQDDDFIHVVSLKNTFFMDILNDNNSTGATYGKYASSSHCQRMKNNYQFDDYCYFFATLPSYIDNLVDTIKLENFNIFDGFDSLQDGREKARLTDILYSLVKQRLGLNQSWNHTIITHFIVPLRCLFSPTMSPPWNTWTLGQLDKQNRQPPGGGVEFSGRGITLTSEFPNGLPQGLNGIPEIIVTPCDGVYYWHTDLKNSLKNSKYLRSIPKYSPPLINTVDGIDIYRGGSYALQKRRSRIRADARTKKSRRKAVSQRRRISRYRKAHQK